MKVLIVNVNAFSGSTGKIVYGLYEYLKRTGNDAKICYRGVKEKTLDNTDLIPLTSKAECFFSAFLSKFIGYDGVFNPLSTSKFIKVLNSYKPDIVHLFNLPGYYINYYKVMELLKEQKIPTVYSMMDEFNYTGKCTYSYDCVQFMTECHRCPQKRDYPTSWFFDFSNKIFKRKQSIYENWDLLTLTGVEWSCERAKQSAISHNNTIKVIPHPINSKSLYTPKKTERLRHELNIPDGNIIVVTATDASSIRKGGKYFFDLAKKMQDISGYTFVFVGYNRNDWVIPKNMITVGYIRNQEVLAEYYSLADLYVCVSIADTFPTTCLNALACGTKLLGFEAGGVPYSAPKEFGTYVPVGDVDAMVEHIKMIRKKTQDEIDKTRAFACATYSEEVVNGMFCKVYEHYFK